MTCPRQKRATEDLINVRLGQPGHRAVDGLGGVGLDDEVQLAENQLRQLPGGRQHVARRQAPQLRGSEPLRNLCVRPEVLGARKRTVIDLAWCIGTDRNPNDNPSSPVPPLGEVGWDHHAFPHTSFSDTTRRNQKTYLHTPLPPSGSGHRKVVTHPREVGARAS